VVGIVTSFTSHHGMGGRTVKTDTGIVPTSTQVVAMPVGGGWLVALNALTFRPVVGGD
jgi:hypothetical protein